MGLFLWPTADAWLQSLATVLAIAFAVRAVTDSATLDRERTRFEVQLLHAQELVSSTLEPASKSLMSIYYALSCIRIIGEMHERLGAASQVEDISDHLKRARTKLEEFAVIAQRWRVLVTSSPAEEAAIESAYETFKEYNEVAWNSCVDIGDHLVGELVQFDKTLGDYTWQDEIEDQAMWAKAMTEKIGDAMKDARRAMAAYMSLLCGHVIDLDVDLTSDRAGLPLESNTA